MPRCTVRSSSSILFSAIGEIAIQALQSGLKPATLSSPVDASSALAVRFTFVHPGKSGSFGWIPNVKISPGILSFLL